MDYDDTNDALLGIDKEHALILEYFKSQIRRGTLLSYDDLKAYAKSEKITFNAGYLKNLRDKVLSTSVYKFKSKPSDWMTIDYPRLGLCSMDYAEFYPSWRIKNKGCKGFVVLVHNATGAWSTYVVNDRSIESFYSAIRHFVLHSRFAQISTILSDKETSIERSPKKFQKSVYEEFGINFRFLERPNKAWAAERAIRELKRLLSISIFEEGGQSGGNTWIKFLKQIEHDHNNKLVPGTRFKRNEVTRFNWLEFLDELYDKDDVTMSFNSRNIDSKTLEGLPRSSKLFKFSLGQEVLLSREGLPFNKNEQDAAKSVSQKRFIKKALFDKTTVIGTLAPSPKFEIVLARLRTTKDDAYIPGMRASTSPDILYTITFVCLSLLVYRIKNLETRRTMPGWFYTNELSEVPVDYKD